MPPHPRSDERAYADVSIGERRAALAVALSLIAGAFATVPFGARPLPEMTAIVPAISSAACVAMLVSASILRNQYRRSGFLPHAFLGTAYGCAALLLVPYMLTFPGVFSKTGFGAGAQTTAWFWVGWHAAFIVLAGGYVWAESYFTRTAVDASASARIARNYVVVVAVVAGSLVEALYLFHADLPVLVTSSGYAPFFHQMVEGLVIASCAAVFATLVARTSLRNATDLWLAVVLLALAIEVFVGGEMVRTRASLAWYVDLFEGAAWMTIFLVVQLRHANEQLAAFAADKRSLIEAAFRDALTGLYNRRGYDARFEEEIENCALARAQISLVAFDIDDFKAYNDYFGHPAGDEVLRTIGKTIATVANRPPDACFRLGGDEFVALLPFTDLAGAAVVAERARAAFARLAIVQSPHARSPLLTVSFGVAAADASGDDVRGLSERADRALYRAKRGGLKRIALDMSYTGDERTSV